MTSPIGKNGSPLLAVKDLRVAFRTWRGTVQALRGVSLDIKDGEVLGLIGESGSGKSVTARAIMRTLDTRPGIVGGHIIYRGDDLLAYSERRFQRIRGREISLVSQDPSSCLNPVFAIGEQLHDVIVRSPGFSSMGSGQAVSNRRPLLGRRAGLAKEAARKALIQVGLSNPDRILGGYAHQLSGGMRQRVLIAMALINNPSLLIADEPTTALDVTVQADILRLIRRLSSDRGLAVLFISHDLAVVSQLCDRVAVMYAGRVVEIAPIEAIFRRAVHPYTKALLALTAHQWADRKLLEVSGEPPDMIHVPAGCAFNPRCALAEVTCRTALPDLEDLGNGHWVECPPGANLSRRGDRIASPGVHYA